MAAQHVVTTFKPVAKYVVIASSIVRQVHTGVAFFDTAVQRAVEAVVAFHRCSILTSKYAVATFFAVTELTILAKRVVRGVKAGLERLIAGVVGT